FGSVAGPLLLFGLLELLANNPAKYHIILLVTAIPLLVTLAIIKFKVQETPPAPKPASISPKAHLSRRFYAFLAIILLFRLGNSSDAFLILRAQNIGVTLLAIPLIYALSNAVYS